MREEPKRLWLENLRSGKYKQGFNTLRNVDNEFCCLGVLCDISGLEIDWGNWAQLPDNVQKWAGLDYNPRVNTKYGIQQLSRCNDTYKLSFKEIADLIEEQL